jgi:CubicO group peptidase (beta-lactamase class C family)
VSKFSQEVVEALEEALMDPVAGCGGQVYVAKNCVPLIDVAVGATVGGEQLDCRHLHSGFCLTKPLLAIAVGHLLERHGLYVAADCRELLGPAPWIPVGTKLTDVLSHSAGLIRPFGFEWRLCEPHLRHAFLKTIENEPGFAYSEIAAGLIIEGIIRRVTGRPSTSFIESEILVPLGLEDEIIVSSQRALASDVHCRVRVPIAPLGTRRIPLLSERLPSQLAQTRPAFGCLVTMRGIGKLFGAIDRVLNGSKQPGLPTPQTMGLLLAIKRGPEEDAVLHRRCAFAGLFQIGLDAHRVSTLASSSAVAHTGGMATCVALADPARSLALGLYLNGSALNETKRAEKIRMRLVDRILAAALVTN